MAHTNAMAQLFGINRTGISRHLNNICKKKERDEKWYAQILHSPLRTALWRGKHKRRTQSSASSPPKPTARRRHMGLATWKNGHGGRILVRAVWGGFDYIEDLIERENTFPHAAVRRQRERVPRLPPPPAGCGFVSKNACGCFGVSAKWRTFADEISKGSHHGGRRKG